MPFVDRCLTWRRSGIAWLGAIAAVLMLPLSAYTQSDHSIPAVGVYYFPGWTPAVPGLKDADPWGPIRSFPEREPLLGWYDGSKPSVVAQQANWMSEYGVDYVIFDWYWDGKRPFLNQSLDAYLKLSANSRLPFALLWANHDNEPSSVGSFNRMVRHILSHYASHADYLKVDGRPVVVIFSRHALSVRAGQLGRSVADLIALAEQDAKGAGYPGIFLIGAEGDAGESAAFMGGAYGGFTAYNYHSGFNNRIGAETRQSHSYQELIQAYESHWSWHSRNSVKYLTPVTVGWNKKPWGGSKDSQHDKSTPTNPDEFLAHLKRAKASAAAQTAAPFSNNIVVCCWNEYGEGSVLEPTKKMGFSMLEQIRNISPGRQKFQRGSDAAQ